MFEFLSQVSTVMGILQELAIGTLEEEAVRTSQSSKLDVPAHRKPSQRPRRPRVSLPLCTLLWWHESVCCLMPVRMAALLGLLHGSLMST